MHLRVDQEHYFFLSAPSFERATSNVLISEICDNHFLVILHAAHMINCKLLAELGGIG